MTTLGYRENSTNMSWELNPEHDGVEIQFATPKIFEFGNLLKAFSLDRATGVIPMESPVWSELTQ